MNASDTKKSRLDTRPSICRRHPALQQRAPDDHARAVGDADDERRGRHHGNDDVHADDHQRQEPSPHISIITVR